MSRPVRRIVSLVPSLTETVCDLGVGGRLVGVTRYCLEPVEALRFVPRIGGTKNPDLEAIARLGPDLVLVNGEENRAEDIAWLRSRLAVFETMPRSIVEAADVVRELGRRLAVDHETESIVLEIEAQIAGAEVACLDGRRVRVFYPIWREPWIGVNQDTYVHDVLTRAGAINVCAHRESRYPVVAERDVRDLRAEVVLLPSEPFAFTHSHRKQLIDARVFGSGVPVLLVDGKDFCWHGSRSGRGLGRAVDLLRAFRRRGAA